MRAPIRTAILISGGGSNMQALVKAMQAPDFPAVPALVISNRPKAAGLEKARALGVKAICIDHKAYESREDFERDLDAELRAAKAELICAAGFMRILTPWFVRRWEGRQINIHPSLLPKYKGLHTHQRALDAGDSEHGCTVHFVSEGVDAGEIIAQAKITIEDGDTPVSLAKRLLSEEHNLYPKALKSVAATMRGA